MANYEQVLHLIRYKNWHTEALFDRKFKLVCSELNGRYISNDFKVEVRSDGGAPILRLPFTPGNGGKDRRALSNYRGVLDTSYQKPNNQSTCLTTEQRIWRV